MGKRPQTYILTSIAQFVRLYGVILSAENNKDGTLKERIKDTLTKNPGTGLYENVCLRSFPHEKNKEKVFFFFAVGTFNFFWGDSLKLNFFFSLTSTPCFLKFWR